MIKVFYDGSCEPVNPGGNAGFGAVIFEDGIKIHEISKHWPMSPENSNNVAEYSGLISALEWLWEQDKELQRIEFFGDNMMTVMQMKGDWKAKKGLYLPHYHRAKKLKEEFPNISFTWIPREQNELADELSRRSLK